MTVEQFMKAHCAIKAIDEMSLTVTPDFYRLRLLWRRIWPFARRRERLALITAVMTDARAAPDIAERANGRHRKRHLLRMHDACAHIGGAHVYDVVHIQPGSFEVLEDGINRIALFSDERVYAYRVE